jgi:hypothetical protein
MILYADSLVELKHSTAAEHFAASQAAALIRKYPYPSVQLTTDAKDEAIRKFVASEHKCMRTNALFRCLNKRNPYSDGLEKARRWIAYVLGDKPDLRDIYSLCSWGPGASIGVSGVLTNRARKLLSHSWSVTPGALLYARSAMITDQHIVELLNKEPEDTRPVCLDPDLFYQRFRDRLSVCNYNKIAFVPKTALVDRTIAVEPLLNGFVQKGTDLFMRKKLKRVGIDLSDQSVNQRLAREGSVPDQTDPFVTIDLSSASDSISIGLCRYLLPPDWFDFLNSIRSPCYLLEGEKFTYHKFTSMGNGFCFPLETLIFASLCVATRVDARPKHDFSVYGDDIIVKRSTLTDLLKLLKVCGFKVNTRKSFFEGPFRESCGADWFEGRDVRPISLDYAFDSVENIFKFCNLVRAREITSDFFYEHLEYLEALIPPELLFTRPYKGDVSTALEVPFDRFMTSRYAKFDSNIHSWSWLEIIRRGKADRLASRLRGYHVALMKAAIEGSSSQSPFTERRNTRTKIRRNAYSGATSTWMPVLH